MARKTASKLMIEAEIKVQTQLEVGNMIVDHFNKTNWLNVKDYLVFIKMAHVRAIKSINKILR